MTRKHNKADTRDSGSSASEALRKRHAEMAAAETNEKDQADALTTLLPDGSKAAPESEQPASTPKTDAAPVDRRKDPRRRHMAPLSAGPSRLLKVGALLTVAVFFGYQPAMSLVTTTSTEAFLNTTVFTLRTPSSGVVDYINDNLNDGTALATGTVVASIKPLPILQINQQPLNPLKPLDHGSKRITPEHAALMRDKLLTTKRIANLTAIVSELDGLTEEFVKSRIAQLEARIRDRQAAITSAYADADLANSANQRAARAFNRGAISSTARNEALSNAIIANQNVERAKANLAEDEVEHAALLEGRFVGDSYNNIPWTAQRSIDLAMQVDEQELRLTELEAKIDVMNDIDPITTASVATEINTSITLPDDLRAWEILVSPGEMVSEGQAIMRMIKCSDAIVTAGVEETVYTRLAIGDKAVFRIRGDDNDYSGHIVRLSGQADAAANFAISPNNIDKAPYRVTINVPQLKTDTKCAIGRAGRVTFDVPSRFNLSAIFR